MQNVPFSVIFLLESRYLVFLFFSLITMRLAQKDTYKCYKCFRFILRLIIISIWVLVVWVGMGRTGGQYWRKSHIIIWIMKRQRWVINSITPSWLLLMLYVEPSHLSHSTHMSWRWRKRMLSHAAVTTCSSLRETDLQKCRGIVSLDAIKLLEGADVWVGASLSQHFVALDFVGLNQRHSKLCTILEGSIHNIFPGEEMLYQTRRPDACFLVRWCKEIRLLWLQSQWETASLHFSLQEGDIC